MLDKKRKTCYIVNMSDEAENRKQRGCGYVVTLSKTNKRVSTRPLADKIFLSKR